MSRYHPFTHSKNFSESSRALASSSAKVIQPLQSPSAREPIFSAHTFVLSTSSCVSGLTALPKLPIVIAARSPASCRFIPFWATKKLATTSAGNGEKERRRQRDNSVGRSPPALAATRIRRESLGGSSSVFNRAFWAEKFISEAGSTMAIFFLPV